MELADRVRVRLEELKMSQADLAKKMGYANRSSVNKIVTGRKVSQKVIARLADALEVSPAYLIGWDENPEEQAEYEASILMDEDIMSLVYSYKALSEEQKKAVKQMIKAFSSD